MPPDACTPQSSPGEGRTRTGPSSRGRSSRTGCLSSTCWSWTSSIREDTAVRPSATPSSGPETSTSTSTVSPRGLYDFYRFQWNLLELKNRQEAENNRNMSQVSVQSSRKWAVTGEDVCVRSWSRTSRLLLFNEYLRMIQIHHLARLSDYSQQSGHAGSSAGVIV